MWTCEEGLVIADKGDNIPVTSRTVAACWSGVCELGTNVDSRSISIRQTQGSYQPDLLLGRRKRWTEESNPTSRERGSPSDGLKRVSEYPSRSFHLLGLESSVLISAQRLVPIACDGRKNRKWRFVVGLGGH